MEPSTAAVSPVLFDNFQFTDAAFWEKSEVVIKNNNTNTNGKFRAFMGLT